MNGVSENTTIAAIATPQTAGGIGIVRVSGREAHAVAARVFTSAHGRSIGLQRGYTALYGRVHDSEGDIDEAIALVFRKPASFTGEDVVELSCHGGIYVMRRVLAAVLAAGAQLAGPGEFTRRSFLNGKIGLTEAEAVMELISAQGVQAGKVAMSGRDGVLEKKIRSIRDSLVSAAAHLEAWADYPDEDIPQMEGESLKTALEKAQNELARLLAQFESGRVLREGVETVIAGRPNVGKSTLMNLLSGCERSIVTEFAGTTRDVVEDTVLLGGIPLHLADTAGLRSTFDPVEKIGVDRAVERVQQAQLVFAVFDSSQELDQQDTELVEAIQDTPRVAIINKSDLRMRIDLKYIRENFEQIVMISALSGRGLGKLEAAVTEIFHLNQLNPAEGVLATERQRDAARRAEDCMEEALEALVSGLTLDAVTVSVEAAISALLELTGERATDAVVDEVFSKFCVGK